MLLSRALNRGYAAGRARWPLEFGSLNNDAFWIFDEVQLMSTGLATSLQLDAWRQKLHLRVSTGSFPEPVDTPVSKPCHSLWMSATMAEHWLRSATDWQSLNLDASAWTTRLQLGQHQIEAGTSVDDFDSDHVTNLFNNRKQVESDPVARLDKPKGRSGRVDHRDYVKQLADAIVERRSPTGLTLVIVNTVDRAVAIHKELRCREIMDAKLHLIHSRFRPLERETWSDFLRPTASKPSIIVSTQVVEAGVNLSAEVLFTELAPWASLIQRFGRCARYPGETGFVYWMDLDLGTDKQPSPAAGLPYEVAELVAARERLQQLTDVGLQPLSEVKSNVESQPAEARDLFPYNPRFVPREKDLFGLFDTAPDLSGADVDVSRFIRENEELDVQVFWREVPSEPGYAPTKKTQADRRELCPVPVNRFRGECRRLARSGRIWRWDYRQGWQRLSASDDDKIYAGQVFLLEKTCGGYNPVCGWTGQVDDDHFDVLDGQHVSRTSPKSAVEGTEEDADDQSQSSQWLSVLEHTCHVFEELNHISEPLEIPEEQRQLLEIASRWHDRGKAHPAFQAKIYDPVAARERLLGQPMAKAPDAEWRGIAITKSEVHAARSVQPSRTHLSNPPNPRDQTAAEAGFFRRPGHRHELASALALLETLRLTCPDHHALMCPDELRELLPADSPCGDSLVRLSTPLAGELAKLSGEDFDLVLYLVAAHHGKVRMSLRTAPEDAKCEVPDPCPADRRQARGVRDGDLLPACKIPGNDPSGDAVEAPEVTLCLDPMELGLSHRYGSSWRERTERLLASYGPFRLAYLESLLRAADCRAK